MDSDEPQENDDTKPSSSEAIANHQTQPGEAIKQDTRNNILKLNHRKKCIVLKLEKTRHQLQLKQNELEQDSEMSEQLDTAVLTISSTNMPANTSKKQLAEIIKGFEQLILISISNDKKLLNVFGNAAQKISVLKNLPLFQNIEKERRKPNDSIFPREAATQPENSKTTAIKEFCKYINKMLLQNSEISLKKYKCRPKHIENLELFSNVLVQAGFGKIVEGEIRINAKNNAQAFLTIPNSGEKDERDAFINLPVARRYAFDGDIVRAFVLEKYSVPDGNGEQYDVDSSNESPEIKKCSVAFVIKIVKQTELREVVGSISFTETTSINCEPHYKLRPHDTKMPMVFIPAEMCKDELDNISKEDICGMLYVARILDVDVNGYCKGELLTPFGKEGCLQAEIKAILVKNGLKDLKPYEQKFSDMFEGPMPPPSDEDLKNREDLRHKCVFTIDPITAKDLDDAVSIEKLNSYEYEIGVHISDVSFYLEENSELDNLVKHRATSVYLVNQVIHMLPFSFCFRCSLLPGENKFSFSVFWKWHVEKEELSAPRFTRTIINSCSQLAYEHAQKFIDNPTDDLDAKDLPDILNGWTPNDVKWRVLLLYQIGKKLKKNRNENGSISLNNPKLQFQLDPISGEPLNFVTESRRDAQFLIEELMLLANQSVAKFIHDCFPDKSFLRNHSPPLPKPLKSLKEQLKRAGINLDITSSKSISESMQRLCQDIGDPQAVEACLNDLLTRPMTRAKYFCSDGKSESDLWHYGLSIPIYTHFTSPIRRYADVIVHRLLAAALKYCSPPQRTIDELHELADISNVQKFNAKKAGNDCIELFFKRYLKAKQVISVNAVVTDIRDHTLNVVTFETGHSITIVYRLQEDIVVVRKNVPHSVTISRRNGMSASKDLKLFSRVKINLKLCNTNIVGFLDIFDELETKNGAETSKEDTILPKSKRCNTPSSSSTKSKKQNKSKEGNNQGKKKLDYLSFYAVKN